MSKKIENVFDEIINTSNLLDAYKKVRRGKNRYKNDSVRFQRDETYNILKLKKELKSGEYKFGEYTKFYVYEPKERLIHAPSFKDKIVQIALNNILKEYYNKTFIYDSYGSIDGKGTHRCVDKIQQNLKQGKWEYDKDAYILKVDVKKFFYNIDRDILKQIYSKKVKDKRTKKLLFEVIDSANQIDEKGLPLGNTISQLSANVYMNELDQYAKRQLRIKYYVRYMDDIIIVASNKEKAKEYKWKIVKYLKDKLNLDANMKKTKTFPINQGINSIGFKIYTTHRLLRNDSKKKIKRKVKSMWRLVNEKGVSIEKCNELLNSWQAHAEHGNSYNFIKELKRKNPYLILIKGKLYLKPKIKERKVNTHEETYFVA